MQEKKDCYLGINGKRVGPLSESEIITLFKQNKITLNTKFFKTGMKEWVSLSNANILDAEADNVPLLEPANTSSNKNKHGCLVAIINGLLGAIVLVIAIGVLAATGVFDNESSHESPSITSDTSQQTTPYDSEQANTITSEQSDDAEKSSVAPENYEFAFLDILASNEKYYNKLTYTFHNNTAPKINLIEINGKWLDGNGIIVENYHKYFRNLAGNDKIKAETAIPEEAVSIRLETMFVSNNYAGAGDYKGREYDLELTIPNLAISDLEETSFGYYITNSSNTDVDNEGNGENIGDSEQDNFVADTFDENASRIAKQIISNKLKSPSTAIWHEIRMIDKDNYGRYIFSVVLEATNNFGGYIKNSYYVKFRMDTPTTFHEPYLSAIEQGYYSMLSISESELALKLWSNEWNVEPQSQDTD